MAAGSPVSRSNGTATATQAGCVLKVATQADSTAADIATIKTDFNALLAKLKAAGVMA